MNTDVIFTNIKQHINCTVKYGPGAIIHWCNLLLCLYFSWALPFKISEQNMCSTFEQFVLSLCYTFQQAALETKFRLGYDLAFLPVAGSLLSRVRRSHYGSMSSVSSLQPSLSLMSVSSTCFAARNKIFHFSWFVISTSLAKIN